MIVHPTADWIARTIFEEIPDLDHDEADWLLFQEDLLAAAKTIIEEYFRLNEPRT